MTREERIQHYMMRSRRNLAELMVYREDEYAETLKTQHNLMVSGEKRGVDKATDDFQSRTCENCAFLTEMDINCEVFGIAMERFMFADVGTFGCSKFERKEL